MIEAMAERYGMLPTQILEQATTQDMFLFINASLIKIREDKKARGESIADTFNQSEIDDMYYKFKDKHGNESK
jgi:hypothetical protein